MSQVFNIWGGLGVQNGRLLINSNTAQDATSASTSSFLTSLAVNGAIAGGELAAFILVRGYIKAIYEPRTYVPLREKQAPVLGKNLFWPLWTIITSDSSTILDKTGVDPYFFVRYLFLMAKAMIPIWLISWAILLPANAVKTHVDSQKGLDKFTFGNVADSQHKRYWAHLILVCIFDFWIIWLLFTEMKHWLLIRQKWLVNPAHSKLPQATTVLIQSIPPEYMDEVKLEELFSLLPGGVKRIWLARNLQDMPDLWSRRLAACKKLESAQVDLIKIARKHRSDTQRAIAKLEAKGKPIPDTLTALVDQLVPRSKRPTIRLKPKWAPFGLGFLGIGQKLDTVEWARKEIADCTAGLAEGREHLKADILSPGAEEDKFAPLNSAFIHFNRQIAAHMAMQCQTHHKPYSMHRHYIEMSPSNVIWRNMALNPYEQNVRQALSYAATAGLILLWGFPVTFIGALSSVSTLQSYKWLHWIGGDSFGKKLFRGLISGVLPPVLLFLLMAILPTILRQLATLEGIPSKKAVELDLMHRYFIFLVVHTFFVVTLASGLVSAVKKIADNPSSVANTLAMQMPTASTFFITLVLTQFTGTIGTLLQAVTLAIYYVKIVLLGGSPRSVYKTRYTLHTTTWGTTFPGVTVYSVIVIAYCVISPIINGFGALFFLLSALVYKYLFLWVKDQSPDSDTGGLFFPKAVTHTFVGIYVQQVCLCALFFLAKALPQGIIMVVLIVLTAGMHLVISQSFSPLINPLPMTLAQIGQSADPTSEAVKAVKEMFSDPSPDQRFSSDNSSQERLTKPNLYTASPETKRAPGKSAILQAQATEKSNQSLPTPAASTTPGPPQPLFSNGDVELGSLPNTLQDPSARAHTAFEPEDEDEAYFAVPGGPGVVRTTEQDPNDVYAFFHPATKEPQPVLWLPRDELGLCEAEIEANAAAGVESTCKGSVLNQKGRVQISGPPPDYLMGFS
ncbi:hypothetical protein M231_05010 [Tremella mesenterica]|uniref:CSC1/OSCA1-like 7TM region domain-containing protein n=1 Tax=Tremella mesenterica TaxID=5217 RepID=A0A4Q1BJ77_TREME|nr:hypothetical protein M231_05010 [Tremella mesenterica]